MPASLTPLQETAVVLLTGCQSGGLWFWRGHQQDSCSLHRNPKDGNLDLVGGHVFFDSGRFHLQPSYTAPCKDKGFSSSERWSLQEEIKLPATKRDRLELRMFLYFSGLLNIWIEEHEQQLTWWLGSLHPYLATCRLVPVQHSSTGTQLALEAGPAPSESHSWAPLALSTLCRANKGNLLWALWTVLTSKPEAQAVLPTFSLYVEGE